MPEVVEGNLTSIPPPGLICDMIFASEKQYELSECIWNNYGMPDTSQYKEDPVIRLPESYQVMAKDHAEIAAYLRRNPDLVRVLEMAPDHIRAFFPSSDLLIELFADPESESLELAVVIRDESDPESSTDNLLELTRSWWGKVARSLAGRMMVCLE